MKRIEYEEEGYDDVESWMSSNFGKTVEFKNGCTVFLEDDSGCIWGTNPYGQDWACNYKKDWQGQVVNWLVYWDAPRTETGDLIPSMKINV